MTCTSIGGICLLSGVSYLIRLLSSFEYSIQQVSQFSETLLKNMFKVLLVLWGFQTLIMSAFFVTNWFESLFEVSCHLTGSRHKPGAKCANNKKVGAQGQKQCRTVPLRLSSPGIIMMCPSHHLVSIFSYLGHGQCHQLQVLTVQWRKSKKGASSIPANFLFLLSFQQGQIGWKGKKSLVNKQHVCTCWGWGEKLLSGRMSSIFWCDRQKLKKSFSFLFYKVVIFYVNSERSWRRSYRRKIPGKPIKCRSQTIFYILWMLLLTHLSLQ